MARRINNPNAIHTANFKWCCFIYKNTAKYRLSPQPNHNSK